MPISGICKIDSNTIIYNEHVTSHEYGYGFYSTYLNKAVTLVDTIIPLIRNKEIFYSIILFDHIILMPTEIQVTFWFNITKKMSHYK